MVYKCHQNCNSIRVSKCHTISYMYFGIYICTRICSSIAINICTYEDVESFNQMYVRQRTYEYAHVCTVRLNGWMAYVRVFVYLYICIFVCRSVCVCARLCAFVLIYKCLNHYCFPRQLGRFCCSIKNNFPSCWPCAYYTIELMAG